MPYSDREKQLEAQRRYYHENKERAFKLQRDRRQALRKYVIEVKTKASCADCGIDYPHYVLDFDHVRGEKVGNICQLAREGNRKKLLEEIDKCEIVCGNCHRHRTWMRSAGEARPS
jgi:hypothetical protein